MARGTWPESFRPSAIRLKPSASETKESGSDPASLLAGLALLSRLSSLKLLVPSCQRTDPGPNPVSYREHRVGLEPTLPHYECGVLAAGRPVPEEVEG